MNVKWLVTLGLLLNLTACNLTTDSINTDNDTDNGKLQADAIYYNAKVYTVNESLPWAEAVAIKGDEIIYVGSDNEALQLANDSTQITDLQGQMLLPGFIDAHSHPVSGGAFALALSLDTYAQPEDWVKAIEQYANANKDLPVIFGYGFLASAFDSNGPHKSMIDAVVSDRPVLIMDEGFHGAWANSSLLTKLNIDKDTKDPVPGFSYFKRDTNGNPTGYLLEGTAGTAMNDLNIITEDAVTIGTEVVIERMNQYGITAVFDAGALDVADYQLAVLKRLKDSGKLNVRYVGSYMVSEPEHMATALDELQKLNKANPSISILKIMNDGTVEGKTAAMFTDYQGDPGNKGSTVFTEAQLQWMMSEAVETGLDIHIHALGEKAINDTLNAITATKEKFPDSKSRFAITHIQVITDEDVQRFADLGVIAQSTPLWASYDTEGKGFVSDDQFNRYFRFNSLKQAGAKLTFGSDFPASGAGMLGMSPVFNIEIGHTRQMAGQKDALIQPLESERLDIATLIRGYTIDAAYQLRMEDSIGSLEVGKKADLVVLDNNLFEMDPYSIHQAKVMMTIFAGKAIYKP